MPSEAKIGELVSKASEYVDTFKQTFKNTRASLDKTPNSALYEKGMELSEQASGVIAGRAKWRMDSLRQQPWNTI
jgi:hypothetical protein